MSTGQAAEILDLRAEDENGDAAGESRRDRIGNEFDHGAQAGQAHDHKQHPGHDRADGEIFSAIFGVNAVRG